MSGHNLVHTNINVIKTMHSGIGNTKTYLFYTIFIIFIFPNPLDASVPGNIFSSHLKDSTKKTDATRYNEKFKIVVGLQNLYSTHSTNFKGVGLVVSYLLSPVFAVGLGTEYSTCAYHFDNGWNLTNLRFLPVFLDARYDLKKKSFLTPFLHLSTGASFANYTKENINALGKFYHVSEQGLYLYSGAGISFRLGNYISTFVELGFKGYHMSFNALDVNPHGLTFRFGLEF